MVNAYYTPSLMKECYTSNHLYSSQPHFLFPHISVLLSDCAFILTHYIASMYPSSHNLFQLHLCILCMYGWISAQVGINGILPWFKKIFKNCSFGITFRSSDTFIPQVLRIDRTSESSQQSCKAMYENIKGDQTEQYYKMW